MTSWELLHAVSDRLTPGLVRALLDAFDQSRRRVPTTALVQAIKQGRLMPAEVERLMAILQQLVRGASVPSIERMVRKAADVEDQALIERMGLRLDFKGVNPFAVRAARNQSAQLVTRVSAQSRKAIQSIVTQSIESGIAPVDAARLIRLVIGLNEPQSLAVLNFRQRLEKAGASVDRVAAAVERYSAKLLRQRAMNIARTELIDALTAGQQASWLQAQERGLLPPRTEQEWLVTPDDRLCPVCRPMSGARAPLGGFFNTPLGPRRGPTLHPQCRCALRLAKASLTRRNAA